MGDTHQDKSLKQQDVTHRRRTGAAKPRGAAWDGPRLLRAEPVPDGAWAMGWHSQAGPASGWSLSPARDPHSLPLDLPNGDMGTRGGPRTLEPLFVRMQRVDLTLHP